MLECDVCSRKLDEDAAVRGYTSPGCVLCVPCYEHLDNEVFAYKPDEESTDG